MDSKSERAEAAAPSIEQSVINQVSEGIIASFEEKLKQSPTAVNDVERARAEFAKVGMYRVLMSDTAKMLQEMNKIAKRYSATNPEFDALVGALSDMEQKMTFVATASLNSVPKDAFMEGLDLFQRQYNAEGKWIIDGIYTNDVHALVEFMAGKTIGREQAAQFLTALRPEDLEEVFMLIKKNTMMIVFPTCHLKRLSAMFPDSNIYEAWLAGLPILMDKIFGEVVSRVTQMKK